MNGGQQQIYAGFGSVWWVAEEVWVRELKDYRYGPKPRPWGPGVSIHHNPPPFEFFPMLFGTGDNDGPIRVWGLKKGEPDKITSFGQIIKPARCAPEDIRQQRVNRNFAKPTLNAKEETDLKDWCRIKGFMP